MTWKAHDSLPWYKSINLAILHSQDHGGGFQVHVAMQPYLPYQTYFLSDLFKITSRIKFLPRCVVN